MTPRTTQGLVNWALGRTARRPTPNAIRMAARQDADNTGIAGLATVPADPVEAMRELRNMLIELAEVAQAPGAVELLDKGLKVLYGRETAAAVGGQELGPRPVKDIVADLNRPMSPDAKVIEDDSGVTAMSLSARKPTPGPVTRRVGAAVGYLEASEERETQATLDRFFPNRKGK